MPIYQSNYSVKSSNGKMYSVEFINKNSEFAEFSVNGIPIVPTQHDQDEVVRAFTALDTAIANMAVNRVKLEEAFK